MSDAPNDKPKPDQPTGPKPDGWAAWSRKAGDPLKPKAAEQSDVPETNESN